MVSGYDTVANAKVGATFLVHGGAAEIGSDGESVGFNGFVVELHLWTASIPFRHPIAFTAAHSARAYRRCYLHCDEAERYGNRYR